MEQTVAPVVNRDDAYFWEAARQHRLVAQACLECGTLRHPATPFCGSCQSPRWEARQLSGRGSVFSWIVSKPPKATEEDPGRIVAVVQLAEGFALVSNLVDVDPLQDLRGLDVEVFFEEFDGDVVLPQFRPVGEVAQ